MDKFNDSMKKQIISLTRVINVARTCREDKAPCEIEEGLYVGSFGAARNKDALKSLYITHVLTMAHSLKPAHPNDFVYKIIPVMDKKDTDLTQFFEECFNFIDGAKKQGGAVLVHCFLGRSRSVTVVVGYLMKKHNMSYSQAMEHVKSRRLLACPNPGFVSQLKDFERSIHGDRDVETEEEDAKSL